MPKVLNSLQFAYHTYETLVNKHENREQHIGSRIGLTELDNLFGGFQKTWYVAAAGKAGEGKTAFLTTVMYHFGLQGVKFMTNVLEESLYEIGVRMFSLVSEIDRVKFRDLRIGEEKEDWPKVENARDIIGGFNATWTSRQMTIENINSVLEAHDPDFIIIDYLQLMSTRGMGRSRPEQISALSGYLKGLTLREENPVGVIVASQLTEDDSLAWSRDIERDADIVLAIEKVEDSVTGTDVNSRRQIRVKKTRRSKEHPNPIEVRFNGALSLLADLKQISAQDMIDRYLDRPASEVNRNG